ELYSEVTAVLLNPSKNPGQDLPGSLGQAQQAAQQIPTLFAFDQSVLLVWPQIVVLVGLTVACFALAYIAFMRQEVRA
ncbi:MAG: ABC transporter permease, partial [Chloroflexota bacterium]